MSFKKIYNLQLNKASILVLPSEADGIRQQADRTNRYGSLASGEAAR